MKFATWNIEAVTGYHPITSLWQDFSIADAFGKGAIKETYQRAMKECKDNYKYLTELVMVLNHKIWQWYEEDESIARVYNDLWETADEYGCNHLKDEELSYFFNVLD